MLDGAWGSKFRGSQAEWRLGCELKESGMRGSGGRGRSGLSGGLLG